MRDKDGNVISVVPFYPEEPFVLTPLHPSALAHRCLMFSPKPGYTYHVLD